MQEYIQIITTVDKREQAKAIAAALVEKKLAGCVQVIGPVSSTYRWKGKIETAEEWLCLIKTRQDLYKDLEAAIHEIHPYEVPEILAMPVLAGSQHYLEWLEAAVRKP